MARAASTPSRATGARSGRAGSGSLALWLAIAALVVVADQFTKVLVSGWLQLGDAHPVAGWLAIVRAHNKGAAFSFLAEASGWQRWFFVALGVAASAFIVWMIRSHPTQKLFCFAVSLIMGGAIGNVIDRVLHGHVVDFVQVRLRVLEPLFAGGYFPAFNIADSAITAGAVCLVLDELLRVRRGR